MRSSTVQGKTLSLALFLAAAAFVAAQIAGHTAAGAAVASGLVIGSANGFLLNTTLERRAPILITSFLRLAMLTLFGLAVATLTGIPIMPLAGGIAVSQLVMFGVGVREGLRA